MNVFAVRGAILSSVHQFHIACLYHSSHGKHGPSLKIGPYWYDLCAHFPHDRTNCYVETPLILLGVSYHPPGVDLSLSGVDLVLPSLRYTGTTFRIDHVLPTDGANSKDQTWDRTKSNHNLDLSEIWFLNFLWKRY